MPIRIVVVIDAPRRHAQHAVRNFLAAVRRDEPPLFSQSRTVSQSQRQCRVARGGTLKGAGSQTTDFTDDTDKIAPTGSHLVHRRNARLVSVNPWLLVVSPIPCERQWIVPRVALEQVAPRPRMLMTVYALNFDRGAF